MSKNPKIVLVHEKLIKYGGGETVFEELVNSVYKGEPLDVYTLYLDPSFKFFRYPNLFAKIKVHEIVRNPIARFIVHKAYTVKNPYLRGIFQLVMLPFMPCWFASVRFPPDTEVVLIDSLGFETSVLPPAGAVSIVYVHTPLRVIWGLPSTFFAKKSKFKSLVRKILDILLFNRLRGSNKIAFSRIHKVLANSQEVKGRIQRFLGREAEVVNPPVPVETLRHYANVKKGDFYVFVNRLEPYKLILELIQAFPEDKELVVIGSGSLADKAKDLAKRLGREIRFLGYVDDETKFKTMAKAKALIYPNLEDFGIGMVEALAVGTYVIGNTRGGAAEIVEHKKHGYLIDDLGKLREALDWVEGRFEGGQYEKDKRLLLKRAEKFSVKNFRAKINKIIQDEYKKLKAVLR